MLSKPFIYSEVNSLKSELIEIRRLIHENPELGFQEFKTSAYISSYLKSLGLEVIEGVAKTGVIGLLKGSFPGPTVLIRADMDALPMQEDTDLQFKSKNIGVHHAVAMMDMYRSFSWQQK
jgi:amidohydrolase/hippurate hydrolase